MDIQRLRTLRELSTRKTMAAVADAIGISPSAVSQQISLLEEEAGVPLIERRGRGVSLTPAGDTLAHHATRLLTIVEEARTDLAAMTQTIAGELTLSSFPSIAACLLPPALKELQMVYPDLFISATEMEPLNGLVALRSWQVDLAIIDDLTLREDKNPETLDTFPIYEDRIVAVFHRDHPLATQPSLKLTDLRHELWAIDTRPNTFSNTLFEMCSKRGFEPRVVGKFDAFDVISLMVSSRCAIALMPQIRAFLFNETLLARQFDPPIKRSIYLAIRKGEVRRPTLKILVQALSKHASTIEVLGLEQAKGIER